MNSHTEACRILDRAIELLGEDKWVKGHLAVDSQGDRVPPANKAACKWCMVGAVNKAIYETGGKTHCVFYRITKAIRLNYPYSSEIEFNDHPDTTHKDVIDVLTEARNLVFPY